MRVAAGIIVNLQFVIVTHFELVRDLAHLDGIQDRLRRLQVFVGQFKAVVPERVLAGAQFLHFFPIVDTHFLARAALGLVVDDLGLLGHVRMALRGVGHHHLVTIRRVLEEVIDAFFLHEPAGEVEIGFAVLHAEIARMERALDFVGHVQSVQDFFQDIRNGHVLKNAALHPAGQQPKLRHHFHAVVRKSVIPAPLTKAAADTAEVSFLAIRQLEADGNLLTQ